ncbi:MAG: apolipoprotein N-acyltransferase, partial [Rhizobiaceae bacterium]|nr:apolipoprotein N-acyltransferase [Rhizobiaceae bacterium]
VDGMTAFAVLAFAAPALIVDQRGRALAIVVPVILLGAVAGYGINVLGRIKPADGERTILVRMVQPSVPQDEKWDHASADRIFAELLRFTGSRSDTPPDLVVWPESALPFLLSDRPGALGEISAKLAPQSRLLTGAVRVEGADENDALFYNSILVIDAKGEIVDAADKAHLVPFGEYVPLGGLLGALGIDPLAVSPGAFSTGSGGHLLAGPDDIAIAPLICYEAIFPGAVRRLVAGADLMVNVTNDAWYGRTAGPFQHFRQAQMRAIENGVPMVRVANNGLSAVIDPYGRIDGGLGLDLASVSDVELALVHRETLFSRYGETIAWFGVVFLAALHMMIRLLDHFRFRLRRN